MQDSKKAQGKTVSTSTTKKVMNQTQKRTPCEIWTRVMGYHRSVSHFNKGKKVEHYSRKHFQENISANSLFIKKYSKQKAA